MNLTTAYVFHNVAANERGWPLGMVEGHRPEHEIVLVAKLDVDADRDHLVICEAIHLLFNVGDDPEFGKPNQRAIDYRARGNRSLSRGDVVGFHQNGEAKFYAVASMGFEPLTGPPRVVIKATHGTTPYC